MPTVREVLRENPWSGFQLEGETFVLPDDKNAIAAYNMGRGNGDDTYIHLDAPPQPFTGNPDAPIWLLLMNPSYDEVDIFDQVNEERGETRINAVGNTQIIQRGAFERRRTLMENQYSFNFNLDDRGCDCPWFYVLDESFHTVRHRGNVRRGSYEWWNRYLLSQNICEGDKERLRKFFVLESFPYHSRNFGEIRRQGPAALARRHCEFWTKMIDAALNENKILLCRGREIAERVCRIAADSGHGDGNIFVCRYPRNFNVGYGNFVSYGDGRNGDDIIRQKMEE